MRVKISVLMTVFNAEKFIFDSIKSILSQSFKEFELIIVDDCSIDKTNSIVKSFSDKRIRIFKVDKRLGRTKALNYGLKKCSANVISIQDADDISNYKRLEENFKILNSNKNIGLVCSNHELIDENGIELKKKFQISSKKKILSAIKYINLVSHSSVSFRKNYFNKQKEFFYDENFIYAQDYDLILKFLKDSNIYFIPKILVKIRHHKENMSNSKIYKKIRIIEYIKLLNFSEKNIKNNLKEYSLIKYFKFKNYFKLFLNLLGV